MNKISPNRQKKEKIVAKLIDRITKAKGLVFTSYQGLTHKQLEKLKKAVKSFNAELVVTKNTLLKRAMEDAKWKMENALNAATATLFLYGDPVGPLKEIARAIKEFNLPTIKFGILEGLQMTSEQILKLSALPTREVLLAQLVAGLKSPTFGLHRSLLWNIQKFVMTLKAIESKKS